MKIRLGLVAATTVDSAQTVRLEETSTRYATCGSARAASASMPSADQARLVQAGRGRGDGTKAKRLMTTSSSFPSVVPAVLQSQRLMR